jgi:hypothetical protein
MRKKTLVVVLLPVVVVTLLAGCHIPRASETHALLDASPNESSDKAAVDENTAVVGDAYDTVVPGADTPLTPEMLIDRERYEEAAKILRRRITTGGIADEHVMAESTNMLGDCYLKMATGSGDLKKALFEYLKVVVLYGDVRDEYVRALRNSIRILEEIGGEEYRKKADDLREELKKTSQSPDNGPDKKE